MRWAALTAFWLAAAPVDGAQLSEGAARVLHDLEQATDEALLGEGTESLEAALAQASAYATEFAYHPEALSSREEASFALVYALLNAEPPRAQEAAARMDEAIRSSQGRALELARFGPTIVQYHAERLASLRARGTAELVVSCSTPCRVIINERARSTYPSVLLLGRYRVHVESREGELREDHEIELARAGEIVELEFPANPTAGAPPPPTPRLRRTEEILLLAFSAGVVAGGGATLAPHNQCVDDPTLDWKTDYVEGSRCEQVYNTAWLGGTLVAAGVAGLIAVTYLLIDDEKRRRRLRDAGELRSSVELRGLRLGAGGLGWSVSF